MLFCVDDVYENGNTSDSVVNNDWNDLLDVLVGNSIVFCLRPFVYLALYLHASLLPLYDDHKNRYFMCPDTNITTCVLFLHIYLLLFSPFGV